MKKRNRANLITVDQFGSVLLIKAKGNSIGELKANACKQIRRTNRNAGKRANGIDFLDS